ncbi:MAG: phospholipase D-like domain-containing protein [Lentisphaerota bacterium]
MRYMIAFCLTLWLLSSSSPAEETGRLIEDKFETLDSSWIESATYYREADQDSGYIAMQIKGEKVTYLEVPVAVWRAFKEADSPGAFYGKNIKQKFEREPGEPLWKQYDAPAPALATVQARCAFNEECEEVILQTINEAKESILIAAYAFTRTRVAAALVKARRRGVDVRMKVDQRQAEYPLAAKQLAYLEQNSIPVRRISMTGEYSAMHNKFLVVDKRIVITGSYNFTTTAQISNWENIVRLESPDMAAGYAREWEAIASH